MWSLKLNRREGDGGKGMGDGKELISHFEGHSASQVWDILTLDSNGHQSGDEVFMGRVGGWWRHGRVIQPLLPPMDLAYVEESLPSPFAWDRTVCWVDSLTQ